MERGAAPDTEATERAHTRRVVLVVGSTIVAATLVPHLLAPRGAAAPTAHPTVEQGPNAQDANEPWPEPQPTLPPVPDGCPAPVVEAGVHVSVEWAPLVVVDGREYWAEESRHALPLGAEALTVTCDITEISGGGQALVPKPWPDGSSTVLPTGAVVHEIEGAPRECFLAADVGISWLLRATDENGGTPSACVGVPAP